MIFLFNLRFDLVVKPRDSFTDIYRLYSYLEWNGSGWYLNSKFNFGYTIWWWQLGCKEAWTPLSMKKLFCLIKIRSMHEKNFRKICGDSQISWPKP